MRPIAAAGLWCVAAMTVVGAMGCGVVGPINVVSPERQGTYTGTTTGASGSTITNMQVGRGGELSLRMEGGTLDGAVLAGSVTSDGQLNASGFTLAGTKVTLTGNLESMSGTWQAGTASGTWSLSQTTTQAGASRLSGNFFPLDTGWHWDYSGQLTWRISTSQGETDNGTASGGVGITVLGPRTITVAGRSIEVQTVAEEAASISGLASVPQTAASRIVGKLCPLINTRQAGGSTLAFYEDKDDAVYRVAFQQPGEPIVGVQNPVYLRKPLVVGDSWPASPRVSVQQSDFSMAGGFQGACRVATVEPVNTDAFGQISAVRTDWTASGSFSGSMEGTPFTGTASIDYSLYLAGNVGEVAEKWRNFTITVRAEGESATFQVTSADFQLTNVTRGSVPPPGGNGGGTTGTVHGTVVFVDETGTQPVAGAVVFLETDPARTTVTDAQGTFTIDGVPLGQVQRVRAQSLAFGEGVSDSFTLTTDVPELILAPIRLQSVAPPPPPI